MLTPVAASFLRAAVRARKSHRGRRDARAPARPPWCGRCARRSTRWRRSAPSRPSTSCTCTSCPTTTIVHAWEARPGSGERGARRPAGRRVHPGRGAVDSFRFNLSRQIVGEVRGREIWAMIKAMESGTGSISTTHASDAEAAVRKLVTCAMEAGPHVTQSLRDRQARRHHRHRSSSSTCAPPANRRRPRGSGGWRRSSPSTPASGRRATPPPTSSPPDRTVSPCRACCPTPTGT